MVFIIGLCACTIGCNDFYDTDSNNYNVRYETVTAKVIELSYNPEHRVYDATYSLLFKMPMFKTIPEKGYVTIQYHEMERTFEDIDLYNKYKDKLNQDVCNDGEFCGPRYGWRLYRRRVYKGDVDNER